MKKPIFSLLGVALAAVVWLGSVQIANAAKIQNVFDEIYYSATQNFVFRNTWCDIKNMTVWEETSEKNAFRHEDAEVSLFVDKDDKNLSVAYSIPLQESATPANLEIIYRYNLQTKQLNCFNIMLYVPPEHLPEGVALDDEMIFYVSDRTFIAPILRENGVTKSEIQAYQNEMLNEILLPDWFAANAKASRFSLQKLGEFSVVDDAFAELGEDWDAEGNVAFADA